MHKNKFDPLKTKALFRYEFTQFMQPEKEDEVMIAPVISESIKGKAPAKPKEDLQDPNAPLFKMSKNILFERVQAVDSESDIGEPKFL